MIVFLMMAGLAGVMIGMCITALLLDDGAVEVDSNGLVLNPLPQWTFEFVDGPNSGHVMTVSKTMWAHPQPLIDANGGVYMIASQFSFPDAGGVVLYGFMPAVEQERAA